MNQPGAQPETEASRYAAYADSPPVVVVGAGPVGQRFVSELRQQGTVSGIVMFGEEQWQPYDRVQLSSYLSGDVSEHVLAECMSPDEDFALFLGTRICRIDRERRLVIDDSGDACPWSRLVLATGSRPFVPPIAGVELPGVFTFRNLDDAVQLKARSVRSRHMVVIGGGLLGLETARALLRFNTRVTIIEQSRHLMFHQLDEATAAVLQSHIEQTGIGVMTNARVNAVLGDGRVDRVQLSNGRTLECDTVVIAAGITPNTGLAQDCGLNTGRGVLVDDAMRTSDPDIYAVGECAEHRKRVYGLVAPGFEQASVAAHDVSGDSAEYTGSMTATRLKVVGLPVMSVGEAETEWVRRELTWRDRRQGHIRKLFLDGNRLDAAMAVGDWSEFIRIQEAVKTRRRLMPWHILRFLFTGTLWSGPGADNIADWPAAATICNCKGVTRGELTAALDGGCTSFDGLVSCTGASSVCGSCRPLLMQLLGVVSLEPVRAAATLSVTAVIALLAALVWFLPFSISYSETVQPLVAYDLLWRDGLFKQVSGFTLLALSVLLAFVSLPKRMRRVSWGSFDVWRLVHVLSGVLTVLVLVAHTGFRMGDNINFYLMFTFTGLVLAGAAASFTMGMQHALPLSAARRVRSLSVWTHVLLLWPLPALLGFHIMKTYWY